MKIDPTIQFPNDPKSDLITNSSSKAALSQGTGSTTSSGSESPAASEDTFSLSSAHGDLQTLTSNLANVPEVRSHRVAALQQSVSSGSYHPDSGKIADAIVSDQAAHRQ
jgi:flagellar biosynthesis anti-sigma factor FlgM